MHPRALAFAIGVVATAIAPGLVLTMRPDHLVPAAVGADEPAPPPDGRTTPWSALKEVVSESAFWRFMLFVSLLVLVKIIFPRAHLTWPKYTLRVFGESFPFADCWAINPAMIVSAASVFFMAASTTPAAASVAFIVTLSLGEAPCMGLSQLPMLLAKPVVGTLSGAMLTAWCPTVGPRHPPILWLVIGLSTPAGPIAIVLLRRVIQPQPALPDAVAAPA